MDRHRGGVATRAALVVIALVVAAPGCRGKSEAPAEGAARTAGEAAPAAATTTAGLPWRRDGYEPALAAARERGVPVVLELWAQWCDVCMDMKRVLADPALAPYADRFVWLSLDRERPEHAALMARFPVPSSPSYYVIDPADEAVHARQLGSATAAQFAAFLDAGERSRSGATAGAEHDAALAALRAAERAAIAGQVDAADRAYAEAARVAPAGWPRHADLLHAHLVLLRDAHRHDPCAALAAERLPRVVPSPAPAAIVGVVQVVEHCAAEAGDGAAAAAARRAALAAIDATLATPAAASLSAIDRAAALQIRRYAQLGLGDEAGARATAEQELAPLLDAAGREATAEGALRFWIAAVEVAVYLERHGPLVAGFERAVAELPDLYHPRFVLAQLAFVDGDYDRALELATAAEARAYGPQKGQILELVAEVHAARGGGAAERAAREAVLRFYEGLPPGHRFADDVERARAALAPTQTPAAP